MAVLNNVAADFPFEHCRECEEFEAEMHVKEILGGKRICMRDVSVGCAHEKLCRRLRGMLRWSSGGDSHQTVD